MNTPRRKEPEASVSALEGDLPLRSRWSANGRVLAICDAAPAPIRTCRSSATGFYLSVRSQYLVKGGVSPPREVSGRRSPEEWSKARFSGAPLDTNLHSPGRATQIRPREIFGGTIERDGATDARGH